ncbi:MAG: AraC family transcriptional regulator [Bacteroidota bacterium]
MLDISVPLGLLVAPVVYFMIHYLLNKRLPNYRFVHMLPFLLYLINQTFYYAQSANFKYNSFIKSRGLDFPLKPDHAIFSPDPLGIRYKMDVPVALSLAIYAGVIINELILFYKRNKLNFWKSKDSISSWIKKLAIIFIGVTLYENVTGIVGENNPNSEYITALILTAIIYFIGYEAIKSASIISNKEVLLKYQKSKIPKELRHRIKEQLRLHIETEKPFLKSDFSLKKLAKNINAHPNYISQILNVDFGQSYHEFVAYHRISAAKEYLRDPHLLHTNIEQISEMVGYNSKAAFNRAFKTITGTTPFKFRKGGL